MTEPERPTYAEPKDMQTSSQFVRFVVVGGTGFIVNLIAFQLLLSTVGHPHRVFWDLPASDYNVRYYHVFAMIAFVVANISNYILNRYWTFRSAGVTDWKSEYLPFLTIGIFAQVLGLLILTLFLHPGSPVHMSNELLAQAITIILVTPVNFAGNKLWTFRVALNRRREAAGSTPPA